ncbi:putative short-chain dehydrogenase/reductase family protein [Coniochaeta sp. 2T2.1]|nr:putative short-chain dehydrogenase/reductase family protein [Coniochaeta sp. 2T2.1]
MASKSKDLGHEAPTSLLLTLIRSQFLTTPRRAPAPTDLTGQVAIITGASSGIGLHAARHLLSLNLSHLILAVRNQAKGHAAAARLRGSYPDARVEVWLLEMTSYDSILAFVRRCETELNRLDITILNAGLMHLEFVRSDTGHEEILQVNYLSTFLLAILMLPVCKDKGRRDGKAGRMTIVSSGTALFAKLPNRDARPFLASFDNTDAYPFHPPGRYFDSKMLGHMFFVRMLEYLSPEEVVVNLVEPGMVKGTGLHRDAKGMVGWVLAAWKGFWGRTLDDGAWAYVDAAVVKGGESHGCFLMDWRVHPFAKFVYQPENKDVMDALWDETLAEFEFAGVREILAASKKRKEAPSAQGVDEENIGE